MIRLSGSVKFFCALGSGVVEGGAAGGPDFLRPSASRRCCASAAALSLASAEAFASASSSALADALSAPLLVGDPIRHLLTGLVGAVSLVLLGVSRFGYRKPFADFGFQLRGALLHALIAHRL